MSELESWLDVYCRFDWNVIYSEIEIVFICHTPFARKDRYNSGGELF